MQAVDQFAEADIDYTPQAAGYWEHDAEPAAAAATPPEPPPAAPVALQGGGEMSTREQVSRAIRHGLGKARYTWRQARQHEGGPVHVIENFEPRSMAGQIKYRDGRGWVPPGQEDTWSDEWGVRYYTWALFARAPAILYLYVVDSAFRAAVAALVLAVTVAFIVALFTFGVI